jgi:hypothetical protein
VDRGKRLNVTAACLFVHHHHHMYSLVKHSIYCLCKPRYDLTMIYSLTGTRLIYSLRSFPFVSHSSFHFLPTQPGVLR